MLAAAWRLHVIARRVFHAEQFVEHIPDVVVPSMTRLLLADVENDNPLSFVVVVGRLHRKRESVAALQVDPADDRLKRPG